MRTPTSAEVDFCNTSHAKCLVFQSQTDTQKSSEKETWEQALQKTLFSIQETHQALKTESLNPPEINENPSHAPFNTTGREKVEVRQRRVSTFNI